MTLDVKALRDVCEAATAAYAAFKAVEAEEPDRATPRRMAASVALDRALAAFRVAVNPPLVLALLDRLERAEKVSAAAAKAADEWDASADVTGPTFNALRAALDDEAPR